MKTLHLSLAFAAALFTTATSFADHELKFERRQNAQGQDFYVHVRQPHPTTTVAVYSGGRGLGYRDARVQYVEKQTPIRHEVRRNARGEQYFLYAPDRD